MTVYQKLVLKALSSILMMVATNRPKSFKDIDDANNVRKEIEEELKNNG